MNSFTTAIDPLYAINYETLIKSTTSSSAIKAFTSSIKYMTNNYYTDLLDESENSLFDSCLSSNMTSNIYSSLYNYNSTYSSSLLSSILDNKTQSSTLLVNKYQSNLEDELNKLYTSSNINIKNTSLLNIINENNFVSEILTDNGTIYLDENFSEYNKIICYKLNATNEVKKINIDDFNINNASESEVSCYIAYTSLKENKFPECLNNILSLSNSLASENEDCKKLISFAQNYSNYKNIYNEYQNEQNNIDKINEENKKIEALFDLIDAINEMYSNYNKKKKENYYD